MLFKIPLSNIEEMIAKHLVLKKNKLKSSAQSQRKVSFNDQIKAIFVFVNTINVTQSEK